MEKKKAYQPIIGIDFGNVYSFLSIMLEDGRIVDLLPREYGYGIPSTFTIVGGHEYTCYEPMTNAALANINRAAVLFKRIYTSGDKNIRFGAESILLSDIIKKIIKHTVDIANGTLNYLTGKRTNRVVMACPETYSYETRLQYKKLLEEIEVDVQGEVRHLEVVGMLSEPAAAALDYMRYKKIDRPQTILVFDLGGGTFDLTTLTADPNGINIRGMNTFSTPIKHDGIADIGGQDFTNRMKMLIKGKVKKAGIDSVIETSMDDAAERTKRDLTYSDSAFPAGLMNADGAFILNEKVTREEFRDICMGIGEYADELANEPGGKRNLVREIVSLTRRVYDETVAEGKTIDRIVCVGGASQMSMIQEALTAEFRNETARDPEYITFHDASKAISHGAARYAQSISDETEDTDGRIKTELVQTTRRHLSIELVDHTMSVLVPANTPLPFSSSSIYYTAVDDADACDCTLQEAHDSDPSNQPSDYTRMMSFIYKFDRNVPIYTPLTIHMQIDKNGFTTMTIESPDNGREQEMKCELQTYASHGSSDS